MKSDLKWFSDMPDCEEEDFAKNMMIAAQSLVGNDLLTTAYFITKMATGITRMKREIKKLKMQPVDDISKN